MTGESVCPLVSIYELIGNVVQSTAYYLRMRSYSQEITADSFDQRCPPACRDGAEGVPREAGDKAQLRGLNSKFVLDISVSLSRRLMMLHAVRAESSFKQIGDTAVLKLASLNFEQIVREGEKPKACIAQLA